jgi:hypothetical protein
VRAAKQLGMTAVPTVQLEHLSDEQVRAYVIADNKLAECAGWDRDLLAIELQELAEIDLDFDLEVTGFETPELDLLIGGESENPNTDPADDWDGLDANAPTVSRRADPNSRYGSVASHFPFGRIERESEPPNLPTEKNAGAAPSTPRTLGLRFRLREADRPKPRGIAGFSRATPGCMLEVSASAD